MTNKIRCSWANQNELTRKYHDQEWGISCHDNQQLFELLTLEIFQAGLNWNLILKKRPAFEDAFDHFDIAKICKYDDTKINQLLKNKAIICNRPKILATINNAQVVANLSESFNHYLWSFTDFKTINHVYTNYHDIPSKTDLSEKISRQMKKDGFHFVGPVTAQSFIQAIGIVNDHESQCYRANK